MMDTISVINLDVSEIITGVEEDVPSKPEKLLLHKSRFSTIGDLIEQLSKDYKNVIGEDTLSLYLENCFLPPWESIQILQRDDYLKVVRHLEKRDQDQPHFTSVKDRTITKEDELNNSRVESSPDVKLSNSTKKVRDKIEALKKSRHKGILFSKFKTSDSKSMNTSQSSQVSDVPKENDGKSSSHSNRTKVLTALREARETSARNIKMKLGNLGKPWNIGTYLDSFYFECGNPDKMWLYASSPALLLLNSFVQGQKHQKLSKESLDNVRVGSNVIAMYEVDQQLYRAKVEQVNVDSSGGKTFQIRFIDYGNVSEVEAVHLFQWDPIFEIVPPQAVYCKLRNADCFKTTFAPGSREEEEFAKFMIRNNPFHLTVHQVYETRDILFRSSSVSSPELSVGLQTKSGYDVVSKLKMSKFFKDHFLDKASAAADSSNFNSSSGKILKRNNLDFLEQEIPSKLIKPPEPVHLKDVPDDIENEEENPSSPVHPIVASMAVEKVHMWLERDYEDVVQEDLDKDETNIDNRMGKLLEGEEFCKDHNENFTPKDNNDIGLENKTKVGIKEKIPDALLCLDAITMNSKVSLEHELQVASCKHVEDKKDPLEAANGMIVEQRPPRDTHFKELKLVSRLKEVIRRLKAENEKYECDLNDARGTQDARIKLLKEDNDRLKASNEKSSEEKDNQIDGLKDFLGTVLSEKEEEISLLKTKVSEMQTKNKELLTELKEAQATIEEEMANVPLRKVIEDKDNIIDNLQVCLRVTQEDRTCLESNQIKMMSMIEETKVYHNSMFREAQSMLGRMVNMLNLADTEESRFHLRNEIFVLQQQLVDKKAQMSTVQEANILLKNLSEEKTKLIQQLINSGQQQQKEITALKIAVEELRKL